MVGGEGKVAEVDGGYFGGYVKPANPTRTARSPLLENQTGKRKAVVVIRERDGNTLPAVFHTEGAGVRISSRSRIAKGTVVNADEARDLERAARRFEMKRINHEEAYSLDGACTNWAEEFFSRMRRAEIGHHHHIAGAYLLRYAQEASWREDNRRVVEWRAGEPRRGAGDERNKPSRFQRLLATPHCEQKRCPTPSKLIPIIPQSPTSFGCMRTLAARFGRTGGRKPNASPNAMRPRRGRH